MKEREFEFATNRLLQNTLIRMYDKCGSLIGARNVFDQMTTRDVFSWNVIIASYRKHGIPQKAMALFQQMQRSGYRPDKFTFESIVSACTKIGDIEKGMEIHQSIIESGSVSNVVVTNTLIDMYAKCGKIQKASELFDKMPHRDIVSWNTIITGYAHNGLVHKSLEIFSQMQSASVKADSTTFVVILPVCSKIEALEQGMEIHRRIVEGGLLSHDAVVTSLIYMYAKFGSIQKAHELFETICQRDVVLWTTIIAGYVQNGLFEKALQLFKQMQLADAKPNFATYTSILPACAKQGDLEQGMEIHQRIIESKYFSHVVLVTALIDMYAKCGIMDKARDVFDRMPRRDVISWNALISGYAQNGVLDEAVRIFEEMPQRNVVSWNSIISGYVRNGFIEEALDAFKKMQLGDIHPNSATFASILPACAKIGALEQGMDIHQRIMEGGFLSDVVVVSALVDMYAKCGSINKARELFDRTPQRDVISWNAMILGYAQNGVDEKALETFKQMQLAAIKPDSTTFANIVPSCAKMGALEQGVGIHQGITEGGFLSDGIVASALVDMYAKCRSIDKARRLFDGMLQRDVISWTAMIAGYAQNGLVEKAFEIFQQMQLAGVKSNSTTFASIIAACSKVGALEQGMDIHQRITEGGFSSDVVASALVDMYAKCGSIDKARQVFNRMPQRDVIPWTAMIAGYAQNGLFEKALETFKQMQLAGVKPNSTTFASILPAFAKIGALAQGMYIHQSVMEGGFSLDVVVATALIDMYAKCGSIDKARQLFDKIPQRDLMSWNAMITGYAQNGFSKDALKIFELMKHSGARPNTASFGSVIFACSHAGLVDEGCTYFSHMTTHYYLTPTIDHYVCMVDLLARAGYLENTLNFIIKMPVKPVVVVWVCFLGACRSHMNIGLGAFTATLLMDLDPKNAATYVLLSNIYAEAGQWGEVQMVRRLMKERGIKKIPGCSWVDGHKMVHAFYVGDRSHPHTEEIYSKLEKLA